MLKRFYFICVYFFSWLVFGAVCLALNFFCALLMLMPGRERRQPAVREIIRRLFASWAGWLHAARIVTITWHGPDATELPRPAVCIANHPSLIDATILLARLPDAVCIFKPALRRNPLLAPAAIMAGYVSGDTGVDLIREVAGKVAAGRTLLIFPEGTRTDAGSPLNPLKPGFALIAQRAGAPIQLFILKVSRDLAPRGRPWWHVPQLPAKMDIHIDRTLDADPMRSANDIVAEVQQRFFEQLGSAT
jgi:1-acyl-sn-glycerol-3-phosphate acyltransferase